MSAIMLLLLYSVELTILVHARHGECSSGKHASTKAWSQTIVSKHTRAKHSSLESSSTSESSSSALSSRSSNHHYRWSSCNWCCCVYGCCNYRGSWSISRCVHWCAYYSCRLPVNVRSHCSESCSSIEVVISVSVSTVKSKYSFIKLYDNVCNF